MCVDIESIGSRATDVPSYYQEVVSNEIELGN